MPKHLLAILVCCLVPSAPAVAGVLVSVDTFSQQMTVSVDGSPRYTWPVSTGRQGYATPGGWFRPFSMERDHYSREWDNAPMPYAIFFTERGHAIHGTRSTRALGSPASHGCVRLATKNAAQLFALVKEHGLAETEVEILGGGIAVDTYLPPSVSGGGAHILDFDRFIRLLDGG